jgi:hypothetical protein
MGLPKVGIQTTGLLAVITVVSLGLQTIGRGQRTEPKIPVPPKKIGQWTAKPGQPPPLDAERDSPPAVYRTYVSGNLPPVQVSIARVTTLGTYRGPFQYLFDTDGRVSGNQKVLIPRKKGQAPLHMLAMAAGHGSMAMLIHWVQPLGEDPIPEPMDAPNRVMGTAWLHQPAYVCDVWVPHRADNPKFQMDEVLMDIADAIDAQIKERRFE